MDKASAHSTVVIRDDETGQFVTVKGLGALKNERFQLEKTIDLTKPIADQVLKSKRQSKV
ncbi:hypothetical protein HFC70_24515 [Agrobacterium sp. a22-2]|uniref:hypothetical protein n=1 Tax=Agrobacterium sp. a22-2 TaxID=2283840 RepID=UPI001444DA5F|nr:hypothetical protein [Agrobacterium sp. a22-2]NKN39515.1 hypothetical protein [Agrobacterium sp. a22-2]